VQQWQPHSDKTTPSPRARGRWQRIQNPVLSEVLAREAVGNAYSTLRFWKSSCARPLAANTAPCAFGSPRARGRRQRRQHLAHSQALVREAVGSGYSTLRSSKSSCARPLATNTAACAFASPRARGRLKWIQHPALSQVLVREAVGNGYRILRFRKSSCARPLALDAAWMTDPPPRINRAPSPPNRIYRAASAFLELTRTETPLNQQSPKNNK